MVEGDLVDLTLPTLLQALTKEGSTAIVRLQHGAQQGVLYLCEGAPVHAACAEVVGDEAVLELLGWADGRFRIERHFDQPPRTITHRVTQLLSGDNRPQTSQGPLANDNGHDEMNADERLLTELLTLLTRMEQERVRLADGRVEAGGMSALLLVTTIVNSLVAFVTTRCAEPDLLPSRALPRLAEREAYAEFLGEDNERISIAAVAGGFETWNMGHDDRRQLFQHLCRALLDVLTMYGNAVHTFFHSSRAREQWRTMFDVFVGGLRTAVKQPEA